MSPVILAHRRCPCGGTYDERRVLVRLEVDGRPVEFEDVGQGVCDTCGSKVYPSWLLEQVESAFAGFLVRPARRAG